MTSFAGGGKSRLFELRIYESHSRKAHLKKVEMFNRSEISIFRRVGLHPVFFGQTLIGGRLPNLTYMLGFENAEARDKGWSAFGADPNGSSCASLRATPTPRPFPTSTMSCCAPRPARRSEIPMPRFAPLARSFYQPSAAVVARRLLGHWLVRNLPGGPCGGPIVETEAYLADDPASHGLRRRNGSHRVMYGPPGRAYVYLIYGFICCVNAVCRPPGCAEAGSSAPSRPKRARTRCAKTGRRRPPLPSATARETLRGPGHRPESQRGGFVRRQPRRFSSPGTRASRASAGGAAP